MGSIECRLFIRPLSDSQLRSTLHVNCDMLNPPFRRFVIRAGNSIPEVEDPPVFVSPEAHRVVHIEIHSLPVIGCAQIFPTQVTRIGQKVRP